ncbi:MAG: aspartate-semialdehyde dehydrogenase [Anaerolineaceae bacterium]
MDQKMNKIPVAVLGATGAVGQRFIQLLAAHPWFQLTAVAASERSSHKRYADACGWHLNDPIPDSVREMQVMPVEPGLDACIVFSALPVEMARQVEPQFAKAGYVVCSNTSAFRLDPNVPVIIPEVNADHLALLKRQKEVFGWDGLLIASPNCTTTGIAIPLKPIDMAYGLKKVIAVSMQAVSGAGYPGLSYLDIQDNVIPFIHGEEEKMERETRALLGRIEGKQRVDAGFVLSAQSNRVPVSEGHTICLSLELQTKTSIAEIKELLSDFRSPIYRPNLPSMPRFPIIVREESDRPQPRKDRNAGEGMQVSVGRIRSCPVLDVRMVSVVHNTLRGAAKGAILNAELLVAEGLVS